MNVALVYFKKDGQRKDFPIKDGKTTFGRQDDCDYRIPVDQVSREHCEFELSDDGLAIRDLGSSNGTYVNNKRIGEAQLKPGDCVVIGPVVFIVQIDGNPPDPKPAKTRMVDRKAQPSAEELADELLDMGEEDEDETRKTALFAGDDDEDEDELEPDEEDDDVPVSEDDDDSLSDALEALAGSDDGAGSDPFADLEEEDKKD